MKGKLILMVAVLHKSDPLLHNKHKIPEAHNNKHLSLAHSPSGVADPSWAQTDFQSPISSGQEIMRWRDRDVLLTSLSEVPKEG